MPNDRSTYFECQYDLVNNTAMDTAVFSNSSLQSFCTVSNLVEEPVDYSYATLEHNYFILDGSLTEFPNTFNTPYFSSSKVSDSTSSRPYLDVEFSQPQNFYGITFTFADDYPLELTVTTTDNEGLILTYTYEPDDVYFVASGDFINIENLHIVFTKGVPDRYVKITGIVFGRTLYWNEDTVKTSKLLLDVDSISDKLSINTLDFEIVDKDNYYNLSNENGLHQYFQKRQKVYAYEWLNGNRLFLGKYFLDNFSWDLNLVKLNCVSYIGLLEDVSYNDGDIYNGTLAGNIIRDIFRVANITEYTIDSTTSNTPLYGTIAPGTCRQALREVLFACSSSVRTTSQNGIEIYKTNDSILDNIDRSEKIGTKIIKNDYVYGIEIDYSTYKLNSETENIIDNEVYPAGENTVMFNDAYTNVVITSGNTTITPRLVKKYYCIFELDSDKSITITGRKYEKNASKVTINDKYIESGETLAVKKYNTSLCNAKMAIAKGQEILEYFKYRLTLNIQTLARDINTDGRRWVQNPSAKFSSFIAWYNQRSLNLTGGFIDTAKMIGYYYSDYDWYYTGTELYANDPIGII